MTKLRDSSPNITDDIITYLNVIAPDRGTRSSAIDGRRHHQMRPGQQNPAFVSKNCRPLEVKNRSPDDLIDEDFLPMAEYAAFIFCESRNGVWRRVQRLVARIAQANDSDPVERVYFEQFPKFPRDPRRFETEALRMFLLGGLKSFRNQTLLA